jgi:hypothetical protein
MKTKLDTTKIKKIYIQVLKRKSQWDRSNFIFLKLIISQKLRNLIICSQMEIRIDQKANTIRRKIL